jgi:kumamolisin
MATPKPTATNTPAATSTPTATPAGMPSPTPTGTPSPGVQTSGLQLIVNGGFENGNSGWQVTSLQRHPIITTTFPHTGSYSAYLCATNMCNDVLTQTVTLPASFTHLILSYWYNVKTQEAAVLCYDRLYQRIRALTTYVIVSMPTLCNYNRTSGWVRATVDLGSRLGAYKGKPVQLYFQAITSVLPPTAFVLDDVSLTAS